jgi:hypothetical protein
MEWRVIPKRDDPTAQFIVEQIADRHARATKYVCSQCEAFIDGEPKLFCRD